MHEMMASNCSPHSAFSAMDRTFVTSPNRNLCFMSWGGWAPVRAKQVTSYPRSAKALTVARPMVPVAPKTKIRFGASEVSG